MPLINSSHKQMVQSMANLQTDLLKNPYYLFNDKKANIVDYYNLNTTMSTLDEALKIPYSNLGPDSPLRFNKIHGFYLYGLERIALNLENGDYGLESNDITGDAIILPDTITPYPGDYFSIDILKQKYLFKVTSSTPDTLNNGANYWRIEYKLSSYLDEKEHRVDELVVEQYEFLSGNVGTNYNPVIKKTKYDLGIILDDYAVQLKLFYKSLFYNNKVQTFTYVNRGQIIQSNMYSDYFYDPYLIEFMMRTGILANDGDKYVYISHKTTLNPAFPMIYLKSIWNVLERRDMDLIDNAIIESSAVYISDQSTIFQTRFEDYYELTYSSYSFVKQCIPPISIIDPEVIRRIKENELFDDNTPNAFYNIIIKYMNNVPYNAKDITQYRSIQDDDMSGTNYFLIPMVIFCIESYVKELLSKTS